MVDNVVSQARPERSAATDMVVSSAYMPASPLGDQLDQAPAMQRLARAAASLNTRPGAVAQRALANRLGSGSGASDRGLPGRLKAGIEQLSGLSMDGVRVHRNSSRPAQLQAHAYAQGRDIHLAPGQAHHLPHEAWHVVQQAQGRVRPTRQLKAGIAVNDDAGLEREADRMGARALATMATASPQVLQPLRFDRSPHQLAWIVQLVDYPADSIGTINELTKVGKTKIHGAMLQHNILAAAQEVYSELPPGTPGGFRLGSYVLSPEGALTDKPDAVQGGEHEEDHGMPYFPADQRGRLPEGEIQKLIQVTLTQAGQWTYLMNPANSSIFDTHQVIIDVDCQFNRTGAVGFHKDSRGTTAFVNLTFRNEEKMTGTEHYEDIKGDPGQEKQLPDIVRQDIAGRREAARITASGALPPIEGQELPAYGRISFSDPNLYHSSPLMGNRYGSAHSNIQDSWASTSKEAMVDLIARREGADPEEVVGSDLTDIRALYSRYMTEQYHSHGLEANSERLGKEEKMATKATLRQRRMSADLSDPTRRGEVKAETGKARTFIRTWIRFVPKTI